LRAAGEHEIVGRTSDPIVTTNELRQNLGAENIKERVKALVWVEEQGPKAATALVSVLAHIDASMPAKVWAMIGIARLGPVVVDIVRAPLQASLGDGSPTVRRAAIQAIAAVEEQSARDAVAALVGDDTLDPSAWFDDDCTVSQAAIAALKTLDSLKTAPA
jgi:hypothetical protein